jgi:hypothetical protein
MSLSGTGERLCCSFSNNRQQDSGEKSEVTANGPFPTGKKVLTYPQSHESLFSLSSGYRGMNGNVKLTVEFRIQNCGYYLKSDFIRDSNIKNRQRKKH